MKSLLSPTCNIGTAPSYYCQGQLVGTAGGIESAWLIVVLTCYLVICYPAFADMDTIGVTLLRTVTTNLDGTGIRVGQVEGGAPIWEVNPSSVGLPGGGLTWFANRQNTNVFPNSLGSESAHADDVGYLFYGLQGGVITNAAHVDNFEASDFCNHKIPALTAITDCVVNQSFIISDVTTTEQQGFDLEYDGYAAYYNTLFISGAGNGGTVAAPATCYNGIGVGAYGGASSVGPTVDNGRAKPDITAPGSATSFSTPSVSGSTVILIQAGLRGDGGSDTNSASDLRSIKALLLNGAVKPADWASPSPSPLDPRYGTGIVNVFNSYCQLAAGKHSFIASNAVPLGALHPPEGTPDNIDSLNGWDFNTLSSSSTNDSINHYYFRLGNGVNNASFTATATLVWNRQIHQTSINNLDLFLYQADSGSLIVESTSIVDNVEHIFTKGLLPGRYDLQVLKHGGDMVSSNEIYALAFEFFSLPLNISNSPDNITLTWPFYPAGFRLESNMNLISPTNWISANLTPVITNKQNLVILNSAADNMFFRLIRP